MKCFDKTGHVTARGTPCQQEIAADAAGCIWYVRSPEERKLLALRGGLASRAKRCLPPSYQVTAFGSHEGRRAWAEEMAGKVLRGEVDPKLVAEARSLAQFVAESERAETTKQLVEALLRVEHGGMTFAFLARLTEGLEAGRRRPLPGRPAPLGEAAS